MAEINYTILGWVLSGAGVIIAGLASILVRQNCRRLDSLDDAIKELTDRTTNKMPDNETFNRLDKAVKDLADKTNHEMPDNDAFNRLDKAVGELAEKVNDRLPKDVQELRNQVAELRGDLKSLGERVDLTSKNVIQRVDTLERNVMLGIRTVITEALAEREVKSLRRFGVDVTATADQD